MWAWGATMDPHRDRGRFRSATSTVCVVETLTPSLYGRKLGFGRSAPRDLYQYLLHEEA